METKDTQQGRAGAQGGRRQGPAPPVRGAGKMVLPPSVVSHLTFQLESIAQDVAGAPAELFALCEPYGAEAHVHVLCALLDAISGSSNTAALERALATLVGAIHARPYFELAVAAALDKELLGAQSPPARMAIGDFERRFCATPSQRLALAASLAAMNDAKAAPIGRERLAAVAREGEQAEGKCVFASAQVVHRALAVLSRLPEAVGRPIATQLAASASKADVSSPAAAAEWSLLGPFLQGVRHEHKAAGRSDASFDLSVAAVMEENGYACAASPAIFARLLALASPLDERAVAEVVGLVASTATGLESKSPEGLSALLSATAADAAALAALRDAVAAPPATWNRRVIIECLKEAGAASRVNLKEVAYCLDAPRTFIATREAWKSLLEMFAELTQEPVPAAAVCGRVWSNARGQIALLSQAIAGGIRGALGGFEWLCDVAPLDDAAEAAAASGEPKVMDSKTMAGSVWLSSVLLDTLYALADTSMDNYKQVMALLELPKQHFPANLLLGSLACKAPWRQLNMDTVKYTVGLFMGGPHPQSFRVLERVWLSREGALVRAMLDDFTSDPTSITRALDICQELKVLMPVLRLSPFAFMLELAALAARREYLNLEKWLAETMQDRGRIFLDACLGFVEDKFRSSDARVSNQIYLNPESTQLFLQFLIRYQESLEEGQQAQLKRVVNQMSTMQQQPQARSASGFSSEVEDEANANFQSIYNGQQSLRDAIGMLTRLKNSANEREVEVFGCMVHNLFDEYRFFPKYPDKELRITAQLFGELVQNQLVSSVTLSIALRYILDALSKPSGSKMFMFGKTALEQFMTRLHEWPKFCSHLLMIPNIRQSFPSLVQYLNKQADTQRMGMDRRTDNVPVGDPSNMGVGQMPDFGMMQDSYSGSGMHSMLQGAASSFEPHGGMKQSNTTSAAAAAAAAVAAAAAAAVRTGGNPQGQSSGSVPPLEGEMMYPPGSPQAQMHMGSQPITGSGLNPQAASMSPSTMKLDNALQSMPQLHFTLNAETLETAALKQTFAVPSDAIADKIQFWVNNLSGTNMEQKVSEVGSKLTPEYYAWFANYMIVKRVAQEPNFHHLYLALLEGLKAPELNKAMIKTAIQYVKILIKSERIKTQSSDRSLLKNLGSWLGQMTIAKDKPILQKDIDIKRVVVDAYERGKMIAVIPFVHKILDPCKNTKVFAPPNPWVMGLCSLLTEIYGMNKLKLNLKFEIEMMFKDLGLQAAEIEPSNIVSGKAREMYGNPDFTVDKNAQPLATASSLESQKSGSGIPGAMPRGADVDGQRPLGSGVTTSDISMQGDWLNFVKVTTSTFGSLAGVKRFFASAMESSVREVIGPVVERSVTISCMTARELVLKDFAFEADEARVRQSARSMVAALASSLALVTCKEPLRASLTNHMWQMLHLASIPESVKEQSVNAEVAENLDFCCTVIERHAIEKGIRSIDEALQSSYMIRRKHAESKSATQFIDPTVLQVPNLPEALHPSLAQAHSQHTVYEEFAKIQKVLTSLDGTLSSIDLAGDPINATGSGVPGVEEVQASATSLASQQEHLRALLSQIDILTLKDSGSGINAQLHPDSELKKLVQAVIEMCERKVVAQTAEQHAKQIFLALVQGGSNKLRYGVYLAFLDKLKGKVEGLDMKLTQWFGVISEDVWLQRVDLAEAIIRRGLFVLRDFDRTLATAIASRKVGPATDFAIHIVRQCMVLEPIAQAVDMAKTLDMLSKIAAQGRGGGAGDALAQLVEQAKRSLSAMPKATGQEDAKGSLAGAGQSGPAGMTAGVGVGVGARAPMGAAAAQGKDAPPPAASLKDAAGLHEQVSYILDEWSKISDLPNRDKVATSLLVTLQQSGFLKSDEAAEQFFSILVEVAVSHCIRSGQPTATGQPGAFSFDAVDAFVKLVAFLISRSASESETVNPAARGVRRASQLFRVLGVVVNAMQKASKDNPAAFNPRPFFRMFIGWYMELLEVDVGDEVVTIPSLAAIADALLALQPLRIPAFAYCWLELISHRSFMPKLLLASGQNGWPHFQKLLTALLQFLEPFLRNAELTESIRLMYKGTLRMLLVLLHDFPEFLCKYHFQLCDVIPSSCIQMRNLMLSAFPSNMRLPDPFTPNLKVDLLPEISESPRIVVDFNASLKGLQVPLNTYLNMRQPSTFLAELPSKLLLPQGEAAAAGTRYNTPLLNAVVLYVGMNAIHKGQAIPMEIFQQLVADLDAEGRYLLLNAIANQLRYPNSHTHYFSCVLLFLFAESSIEIVKEQITRVLLERLIVNRPHPWGLLITFIELIKNPRYQFWSHPFTRCAPEVERLFENVARSCIGQRTEEEEAQRVGVVRK